MITLNPGLKVKYVAAPTKEGGKTTLKDAVITEVRGPGLALVDYSTEKEGEGQHTAQAAYSEDTSVENTFHLPKGAVVEPAAPVASSANGAAAK